MARTGFKPRASGLKGQVVVTHIVGDKSKHVKITAKMQPIGVGRK